MLLIRGSRVFGAAITAVGILGWPLASFAQEAPPAPPAQPAPEPAPAPAPAAQPAPEPAPEPAPAPPAAGVDVQGQVGADVGVQAEPYAAPPPPAAEPAAPMAAQPLPPAPADAPPADEGAAAEDEESPVDFMLFVDAYGGWQTAQAGTPVPFHRAYALNSPEFVNENGFSLSFAGLDVSYDGGQLGATASLRFGPSVVLFHGNDPFFGIDNIVQAFVTWKPVDGLALDLGQFGTIYGAEVAESWMNLNYTRGGLYYAMQPFWHTGLRASYDISDAFTVKGMVVNGVNNISDATTDEGAPSLGLQLAVTPSEAFGLAVGGLISTDPEDDDNSFDRFVDVVATLSLGDFSAIANFDYNMDVLEGENTSYWGASLAMGYAFTDMFGLAVRGEYLSDPDSVLYADLATAAPFEDGASVVTLTGTIDVKPVPGSQNLILRWDNRYETSSEDIFFDNDGEPTDGWFASVIGMVVKTN